MSPAETIELLLEEDGPTEEMDVLATSEISFEALTREHEAGDLLALERALALDLSGPSQAAPSAEDTPPLAVPSAPEVWTPAPAELPVAAAPISDATGRACVPELEATPPLPADPVPADGAEATRVDASGSQVLSPPRSRPVQARAGRADRVRGPGPARAIGRSRRALLAALLAVTAVAGAGWAARELGVRHRAQLAPPDPRALSAAALQNTLALAREGRFEEARTALAGAAGEEVERARTELDREVEAGRALGRAGEALAAMDVDGASRALSAVDRTTLTGQKAAAIEGDIAGRRRVRVEELAAARAQASRGPRSGRPTDPAEATALASYRSGDLAGALEVLPASGSGAAAELRRRIAELQRALRTGTVLTGSRAVQPLESARELDRKLGGSSLGAEIRDRLLKAHEGAARAALEGGDPGGAFRHFTRIREIAPEQAEARAQLDSLRTQARQLYLSAYVERDTDPASAILKLRKVVAQTPEGEDVHEKARRWLDRLDGLNRPRADATAGG